MAYALPSAVIWGILGILLQLVVFIRFWLLLMAVLYALVYGITEVSGFPLRIPGSSWQVPSGWIKGSTPARTFIWGVILGPGFVTRNLYAGMWILPFFLLLCPSLLLAFLLGTGIGTVHGVARATGILQNRTCLNKNFSDLLIMGAVFRWRFWDGSLLLFSAGMFGAVILWRNF